MSTASATAQMAEEFAGLCRQGRNLEAVDRFYAPDIVSVEAGETPNLPREMRGIDAVRGKNVWWFENNDVHSAKVSGPYVGDGQFALHFEFEVSPKATGQRRSFTEMALYTVRDGRVVREQFFYNMAE